MAGENEIVIPISADITKLIEQINKLTGDVDELRSAGQEAGNDIKKAFVGAEISVDNTTKAYQELEKEINDVKNAMKGQRDPKVIANQKQYISELQKEQTELRNTGKAFVTFRTELRGVIQEMTALDLAGQKNSARYLELQKRAGTLTDAMMDSKAAARAMGSDTRTVDAFAQGISGVTAAFSVYQGVLALVGSENKDFQKTMTKVMGAMALANGVQQIANMLQKESALMVALNNAANKIRLSLTKEQTTAKIAENIATEAGTKATGGAEKAVTGLTGALGASTGVVALWGAALIAAVATMVNYVKWITTATERTDEYNLTVETANTNLSQHRKNVATLSEEINNYIKKLYESGKTEKEQIRSKIDLAKQEAEAGQRNIKQKIDASQTEINLLIEQNKELQKTIDNKNLSQTTIQAALNQQSKNIKAIGQEGENQKQLNDELKAGDELITKIYPEKLKQIEAAEKYAESVKKQTYNLKENNKEQAKKEFITLAQSEAILQYFKAQEDAAKAANAEMFNEPEINIPVLSAAWEKHFKKISDSTQDASEEQKTFWEQNGEAINKWVGVATEAIGIVFAFMQQNSDAELQTISDNFDKQSEKYKTMLDKNLISQEQYDAKVSQLEKEKAAKEKKIKHDAFEQERTAKIINATISGLVGALAQYEAGPAGAILSALVGVLTIANVALIASQKNPYRKGTAQILGGRSHEQGGVSLGSFGEAEQGEFLGILSKRQTSTYGNGLMNLFEGLNKNNKDKVLTGLTDIASNVGFSDTNTNFSVTLNEVKEIKDIRNMMKKGGVSITYHSGFREEKSTGNVKRIYG